MQKAVDIPYPNRIREFIDKKLTKAQADELLRLLRYRNDGSERYRVRTFYRKFSGHSPWTHQELALVSQYVKEPVSELIQFDLHKLRTHAH